MSMFLFYIFLHKRKTKKSSLDIDWKPIFVFIIIIGENWYIEKNSISHKTFIWKIDILIDCVVVLVIIEMLFRVEQSLTNDCDFKKTKWWLTFTSWLKENFNCQIKYSRGSLSKYLAYKLSYR